MDAIEKIAREILAEEGFDAEGCDRCWMHAVKKVRRRIKTFTAAGFAIYDREALIDAVWNAEVERFAWPRHRPAIAALLSAGEVKADA